MNAINEKLEIRHKERRPVKVGLVGAGQMGQEIIAQVGEMVGMDVVVVTDITVDRARHGYSFSARQKPIVEASDPAEAARAVHAGHWVVGTGYPVVTDNPEVEAVIDATGSPHLGAEISCAAIAHSKHIIMMNVECDVTVGPALKRLADKAGVVYTLSSGDEPSAILELWRFAKAIGFEVVAAGKGKNNPLDVYATPSSLEEKARARDMNARMLCEFVDGSKTMVEMCAVSNATGLVPDKRGMHGAHCNTKDLHHIFTPKADGGILSRRGCVDFAIGDVNPGVFVVFTTGNKRLQEGLAQRDMGNGPYYNLFRPFHLCSCEVPLTVARAVFYGESSGHPMDRPVSECFPIAKRNLTKGETLDAIGETCYRGSIDLAVTARAERLLPLGLASGMTLTRDVARDTPLTWDVVNPGKETKLLELRRNQDKVHW